MKEEETKPILLSPIEVSELELTLYSEWYNKTSRTAV
jgi:hypothetical protein